MTKDSFLDISNSCIRTVSEKVFMNISFIALEALLVTMFTMDSWTCLVKSFIGG